MQETKIKAIRHRDEAPVVGFLVLLWKGWGTALEEENMVCQVSLETHPQVVPDLCKAKVL